jgi:hypothetical protein
LALGQLTNVSFPVGFGPMLGLILL